MIDPIGAWRRFPAASRLNLFGMQVPGIYAYYYLFLALTLLIMFISLRLQDSRIGRAWVAIREDEVAAEAMGINTRNIKLLAFAMGASFGGISGGLFAGFQGFVSPESFSLMESIMILCMVVLGGMGHIPGVILGAVLLTVLPEALRYIGPLEAGAVRPSGGGPGRPAHADVRPGADRGDAVPSRRAVALRRRGGANSAAMESVLEQEQEALYDARR